MKLTIAWVGKYEPEMENLDSLKSWKVKQFVCFVVVAQLEFSEYACQDNIVFVSLGFCVSAMSGKPIYNS